MNNEVLKGDAEKLLASKLETYKVEKIAEILNFIKDAKLSHDIQIKDLEAQIERVGQLETLPRYGYKHVSSSMCCDGEEGVKSKSSGIVHSI